MGKESRAKAQAPELMLNRLDVPAVAALALMDALTIDGMWTTKSSPVNREMREYRTRLLESIKVDVKRLHDSYNGRVTEALIQLSDRYLCRVQRAMDEFFDEITDQDLADMADIKAKWGVTEEGPC